MQDHNDELVWGLGHARMLLGDGTLVNGPLLEILVQVELARDGALLVRPRNHTGVSLNREVAAALTTTTTSAHSAVLSNLHKTVAELEPSEISPGQPNTYVSLLKRIALEMSPDGSFQPSSTARGEQKKLVVTEAWCLYSRPKPSSVWARDANVFADQLLASQNDTGCVLSKATWAFTHGPASLDHFQISERDKQGSQSGALEWLRVWFDVNVAGKQQEMDEPAASPMFPLPASESQNRIADLLLSKNYPAVVCEGPPGTGKSHTIANMICAYLCQGKRVLVTSNKSPALSVLRHRLPSCVQELCVDVSMSESEGMRHLQQAVERLAMRIASVNAEMENQKYLYLKVSPCCIY
jgi:hypothetical protein